MGQRETIRRIQNLKAIVIVSGCLLIVAGIVMIFMDIRSEGIVVVKSQAIGVEIYARHAGLFLIVLGAALGLGTLIVRYTFTKQSRIVESDGLRIREKRQTEMTHSTNGEDDNK